MEQVVSTRTSVGNTDNKALKVVSLVAAFDIPERTSVMIRNKKYANKKDMFKHATKSNVANTQDDLSL